jgi:DNA-directed RNA polymerase specialized sigma24 family protein
VTPPGLSRYRAERLLRKDFAGLRFKVLGIVRSQLRAMGIALDPSDLEACYAMAWHGLYATVLEGETVENPSAWLVTVTFRRAIDEHRSAERVGLLEREDRDTFPGRLDARAPDLAAELDNRARLRHVFEGMRASLSKRECEAASLCYLQGLSRAQAAERMGISEARMGKLMEGAGAARPGVASKVGALLDTIKAGGWCEQQSSLMRAYAFGVLDPEGERHALAVAHTRECPACRAHVASLRGLASVLPLPLLSPLALAGAGASAGAAAGAAGGGSVAATRLAATGLRLGGRTGGSWGGVAGSLPAKIAVTAVVVVGSGYGLLGSRAHNRPPPHRAVPSGVAGVAPIAPVAVSQAPFSALGAPARRSHPTRRSSTTRARHRSSSATRSSGSTVIGEFTPERVRREQAVAPLAPAPAPIPASSRSPSGSSGAAREFGIE